MGVETRRVETEVLGRVSKGALCSPPSLSSPVDSAPAPRIYYTSASLSVFSLFKCSHILQVELFIQHHHLTLLYSQIDSKVCIETISIQCYYLYKRRRSDPSKKKEGWRIRRSRAVLNASIVVVVRACCIMGGRRSGRFMYKPRMTVYATVRFLYIIRR